MFKTALLRTVFWCAALPALATATTGCSSGSSTLVTVKITVDSSLLTSAFGVTKIAGVVEAPGRQSTETALATETYQEWQITPQNVTSEFTAAITVVGRAGLDAGGGGGDVVTSKAYVVIKPGLHTTVPIVLSAQCARVFCPGDQTCSTPGVCGPIQVTGGSGGAAGGAAGGHAGAGGRAGAGGIGGGAAGHGGSTGGMGGGAGLAGTGGGAGVVGTGGTAGLAGTGGAGGVPGTGGTATGGVGGAGQGGMGGKAKLNPGDACTANADCAAGVCSTADHVCCDSACTGVCESCLGTKTGKANGLCSPLPAGSNADNDCAPGTTTCGTTGSCDGNRKCALAPATTPCAGTSTCTAGQLTVTPAACSGTGTCVAGTASTAPCPGGVSCMSATACLPSTCTADANCTTGSFCDSTTHTCLPKHDLGAACTGTNQCTAGFCADGVCCNSGCAGTCEACVKAKTGVADGHCAAVTAATDPDNECAADGTACGHTGVCDHNGGSGAGACAFTASATSCGGTFTCSGSGVTATTTGACDGAGTCKQSGPTAGSCSGYGCASTSACGTSCTGTSGCASGYSCVGGTCTASVFKNGPCVTTPDFTTAVVIAIGSDGKLHQKTAANGTTFGAWATLSLDASGIDTRSDLDCSANSLATHITATGTNPLGAVLHASGSGTNYNAFIRDLTTELFTIPGASIKAYPSSSYVIGGLDTIPAIYEVSGTTASSLQPLTTYTTDIRSTIDVSAQACCGGATRIFVGFDSAGAFDVYSNSIDSGGSQWYPPLILSPPAGTTFQFSPTICVDTGSMGGSQVHLAAVAGGSVYDASAATGSLGPFSAWEKAGTGAAAAVDCTMMGDGTVHIVTLNSAGHVLDIHGKPGSWSTADLGVF